MARQRAARKVTAEEIAKARAVLPQPVKPYHYRQCAECGEWFDGTGARLYPKYVAAGKVQPFKSFDAQTQFGDLCGECKANERTRVTTID